MSISAYVDWQLTDEEQVAALQRLQNLVEEGHYQVFLVYAKSESQFSGPRNLYEETLRYHGQNMMECLQLFILDEPRIEAANSRRKKEKNFRDRT